MKVHQSLERFVNQFMQYTDESQRIIEYDSAWPSMCVLNEQVQNGERVVWSPQAQYPQQSFTALEDALGFKLHEDIKAFYTVFWSDNLPAQANFGHCELLQVWNEDDFERLQENIIGHILMKQRLKQPISIFFGVTDDENLILTVDNATGAVFLEPVGKPAQKQLARSLSDFIELLTFT
jgi:SecY interacting protein Syd